MMIIILLIVISVLSLVFNVESFRFSSTRFRKSQSVTLRNDLLGEQLKELQEGIQEFQQDAFKELYNKNVSWAKSTEINIEDEKKEVSITADEIKVEVEPTNKEEVLPIEKKVEPVAVVETLPVPEPTPKAVEKPIPVKKPVPTPPTVPIVTTPPVAVTFAAPETKSSSEGISLKSVPIIAKIEPVESVDEKELLKATQAVTRSFLSIGSVSVKESPKAVEPKEDVIKATQAVTKSFLSLSADKEVDKPKVDVPVPSPRPVTITPSTKTSSPLDSLFGFLKSDPNVDLVAQQKQSAPPSVAKAFTPVPATTKSVPVKVAEKVAEPVKAGPTTDASAGLFGFLSPKQSVSQKNEEVISPAVATKNVPAVAAKTVSAPKTDVPGGFFGFLNSKPSDEVSKPSPAVVTKPAPVVAAPVTLVPTPKSDVSGGFFGFLNPTPVSKPAVSTTTTTAVKPPTPAVVKPAPVVAKPAPVIAKPAPVVVKPAPVIAKPAPVIAKPAPVVAKAAPVTLTPKSEVSGGFFGFLNPTPVSKPASTSTTTAIGVKPISKPAPVIAKPAPVIAKAAPVVAKAAPVAPTPKSEVSGGFFGFLNPTPVSTSTAKTSTTAIVAKPAPVIAKPAPVIAKPAPVVAKAAPVSTPPKSDVSGGFFGFLNPTPVSKPASTSTTTAIGVKPISKPAPVVAKAVPVASTPKSEVSGGFFGFLNPTPVSKPASTSTTTTVGVKQVSKPAPVVAKPAPVTPAPKSEVSGGFFGFLNPKPVDNKPASTTSTTTSISSKSVPKTSSAKPVTSVVPKSVVPVKATPAAVPQKAMNQKFQSLVSTSLKNDTNKKALFQQKLDSFRAGNIDSITFIKNLEILFGANVNLDSIITPLISEIPEKALSDRLKAEYAKRKK